MRNLRVAGAGSDGVPREVFGGDTARMNREAQERLTAACDDGVPTEMVGGETTRIDQHSLTGLIVESSGLPNGTPKRGMPQFVEEPEIQVIHARGSSMQMGAVEPVGEAIIEPLGEPVTPLRQSRARDFMIGGVLAILVMAAWYCSTQL